MPESHTKTFPVSWEELHRNGRALAWRLGSWWHAP